jgi:hypothetical protein
LLKVAPAVLPPVRLHRRRNGATHRESFRRKNGHAQADAISL